MSLFSRSKSAITKPTSSSSSSTAITLNNNNNNNKEEEEIVDEVERVEAVTFCVRGGVLIKYGRRGKPHGAEFKFSLDGRALEWLSAKKMKKEKKTGRKGRDENDDEYEEKIEEFERNGGKGASTSRRTSSNKSILHLRDVVKVTKGRDSKIFNRFPNLHDEKCSFFIEYVEGGGNNLANVKSSAKNYKVRTLNVVAEDERSRDQWVLGIETTLLIAKGLYYLDASSSAMRLKHAGALAARQRQSFRVNVNTSKHSRDVTTAFEERTRDHSKDLFDGKQDFIAKEGEDFGSTIRHIRQLSRSSYSRLSNVLSAGWEGGDQPPVSMSSLGSSTDEGKKEDGGKEAWKSARSGGEVDKSIITLPGVDATKVSSSDGIERFETRPSKSTHLPKVPESLPSSYNTSQRGKSSDENEDTHHSSSTIYSTENSSSILNSSHMTASEGKGFASTAQGSSAEEMQRVAAMRFSRPKDIYVWGNFQGEGNEGNTNFLPSIHKGFEHLDPIKVSAGRAHFVGISKGGFLYFWGDKQRHQCGDAVTTGFHDRPNVSHPMKLSFPTDDIHRTEFVDCACGDDYSLALTRDGEMKAWGTTGWVEKGSIGRDSFGSKRVIGVPVSLVCLGARKVCKIACGPVHCAAICDYGESVYTWGEGVFYALGHGNDSRTLAKPKRVEALVGKTVTGISCGAWHTVACVATSTSKTAEKNIDISGYRSGMDKCHKSAIADSFGGEVYVWGDGSDGQLGCRVDEAIKIPTKINIENNTYSYTNDANEDFIASKRATTVSTSITKVACGAAYTILLSVNGDVFISGKLGKYSSKTFEIIPELAPERIGNDLVVTRISAGTDSCLFAASSTSVMTTFTARKGDGKKREKGSSKLFAIGGNKFGKIGDGTLREAAVPIEIEKLSGMTIKSLACGGSVSAAIVARSGRDKIEQNRKAKKAEKKLSMTLSSYQRPDSILRLNSFGKGSETQMKDKKLIGGVLERTKSKLSRISTLLAPDPMATSDSSISRGFDGTITNNRGGDDQSAPANTKDKTSESKTLLNLSASLRSLATPPLFYDSGRPPPPSPIPESPASASPGPRKTPPPRPSVIKETPVVASTAPPPPPPPPPPPQLFEYQSKTNVVNASNGTASINPAPSMSSRERLVQLVERNAQDMKLSGNEEAVEKGTIKKNSPTQHTQRPPPLNMHGRSNVHKQLNPAFIKKANSDVDIVKTPPPSKKSPPLQASKTTTRTTTTIAPKSKEKSVKGSKIAAGTTTKTVTDNKNKWVEEIEPGVFLTFTKLDALRTTVTRVQFARRVFENDAQGLKWWQDNRARIFRERKLAAPTT